MQARVERGHEVAEIVREDGDELLGGALAALRRRVAGDFLDDLGSMSHRGRPPRDGFGEAHVVVREVIRLQRRQHEHAAPRAGHHERRAELGPDLQTVLDAAELFGIVLETSGDERAAGLVDVDDAPAVADREDVEPELALRGVGSDAVL